MGLLTLMSLPSNRPIAVNEYATQIVPSMLMLFDGLNRAYNRKNTYEMFKNINFNIKYVAIIVKEPEEDEESSEDEEPYDTDDGGKLTLIFIWKKTISIKQQ